MFTWTLVDTTGKADPTDLARIVETIDKLDDRWAAEWGFVGSHGVAATAADAVAGASTAFRLVSEDPNVPNALGFHDEANDTPYVEVLIDIILQNGGGWLQSNGSGASVASVVAHEFFEARADFFCVSWSLNPTSGLFLATETADPVQGEFVTVTSSDGAAVELSDAVFPRYFDPQATEGPYDLSGAVTAPFQCLPGGYQIWFDPSKINDPAGPISNVWGEQMPTWMREAKRKNAGGRLNRRLKAGVALAVGR